MKNFSAFFFVFRYNTTITKYNNVSFRLLYVARVCYVYVFRIYYRVKMQYNGFNRDRDRYIALRKKETPQFINKVLYIKRGTWNFGICLLKARK